MKLNIAISIFTLLATCSLLAAPCEFSDSEIIKTVSSAGDPTSNLEREKELYLKAGAASVCTTIKGEDYYFVATWPIIGGKGGEVRTVMKVSVVKNDPANDPTVYRSAAYNDMGCKVVNGFLLNFASRIGVTASGRCDKNGVVTLQVKGKVKSGDWDFYPGVCVDGSGDPFVSEAAGLLSFLGGNITKTDIKYEIGGPAFCRPGLFNLIQFSWN